jgi:transposase-like protein
LACEIGRMRNTRSENKAGSRRRRSAVEADEILERYAESGLTQRVFAREAGIGVSTLQYWLRRKAQMGMKGHRRKTGSPQALSKVSLLEVELAGEVRGEVRGERRVREGYEIEWAEGMRLRLPSGFREEEVRRLLWMIKEVR